MGASMEFDIAGLGNGNVVTIRGVDGVQHCCTWKWKRQCNTE